MSKILSAFKHTDLSLVAYVACGSFLTLASQKVHERIQRPTIFNHNSTAALKNLERIAENTRITAINLERTPHVTAELLSSGSGVRSLHGSSHLHSTYFNNAFGGAQEDHGFALIDVESDALVVVVVVGQDAMKNRGNGSGEDMLNTTIRRTYKLMNNIFASWFKAAVAFNWKCRRGYRKKVLVPNACWVMGLEKQEEVVHQHPTNGTLSSTKSASSMVVEILLRKVKRIAGIFA
ncbi:hypothetical protein P153DRAFT_433137 [Dothidotthia symphoricarpi CBS 119687]|uniref:Uncharacterized protein n=1 Tax=Dothidotthia symphoricarpi CBS 119687 TaxID=1392245 RepID=A0A6A6A9K7_9PLEO|nr:uncharacterized protein P153DRAFT_433137 [Dothidotthia symphoricarpi CBS 119687]KAF2127351.1 hypothetical protein P153DRAFT_433137 [Dothidotthia symphoricarpi CBS 119687]